MTDVVESVTFLFELAWQTIQGMFDQDERWISSEIDAVVSWGNADRGLMMPKAGHPSDNSDARWRDAGELRFCLRSIYHHMPFVRRIYIVTNGPIPKWFENNPQVTVVHDSVLLPRWESDWNNSHAVESSIHTLPQLAEHFIYFNDDMVTSRTIQPHELVTPAGNTFYGFARTRVGPGEANASKDGWENAALNNRRILQDLTGIYSHRHIAHGPVIVQKSLMYELEALIPEEFARLRRTPRRSNKDLSVLGTLYHLFATHRARAAESQSWRVGYVNTTSSGELAALGAALSSTLYDFVCLNDEPGGDMSQAQRVRGISQVLQERFSQPAPWEQL